MSPRKFKIRVPASSANLGPGFDTLGLALTLYLDLHVTIPSTKRSEDSTHPQLSITYDTHSSEISCKPEENLILQACIAVATSKGIELPSMHVHCVNEIPYGSGLGSSGSAIVAGVSLANHALQLGLTKEELLPFCLEFDGHPDVWFNEQWVTDRTLHRVSLAAHHVSLPFNPIIRAIVATPSYTLPTSLSRSLLPETYTRSDLVFNMQRCAILTTAFGNPDSNIINGAMQDRVHQQYRQALIPGFQRCLDTIGLEYQGLLGLALSGAGPSVIALATEGFDTIGEAMKPCMSVNGCEVVVRVLECDRIGARLIE